MIREDDLGNMLTREQAAELLDISVPTLDRLLRDRKIEFLRVGGRNAEDRKPGTRGGKIRISRRACVDWLNKQVVKPTG